MPEKLLVDLDGIDYNKGNLSAACSGKVSNVSFFRKAVKENLLGIFKNLFAYHMQLDSRLKAEGFKSRVMNVFKAWEDS
ncbi:gar2 [Culex quinquefasciatus]|uniref:Gar2 n=1 Tax=Culex quinquefasciatus TaxID=7176 RepID=B0WK76_CULQU|nr:gar2 [Culex quinquefasciatus]|eukprot:XP_001849110.1 gar2 [Culex quinquefasciatus]